MQKAVLILILFVGSVFGANINIDINKLYWSKDLIISPSKAWYNGELLKPSAAFVSVLKGQEVDHGEITPEGTVDFYHDSTFFELDAFILEELKSEQYLYKLVNKHGFMWIIYDRKNKTYYAEIIDPSVFLDFESELPSSIKINLQEFNTPIKLFKEAVNLFDKDIWNKIHLFALYESCEKVFVKEDEE